MTVWKRVLCPSALLLGLVLSPFTHAGTLDGRLYELQGGSTIIDECLPCDRAPIERPLSGTMLLTLVPSFQGTVYEVTELSFQSSEDEYTVKGGGLYQRDVPSAGMQEMTLDAQVNDVSGVSLRSPAAEATAPWPILDIRVTEDGQRDPFHVYSIRILATPVPEKVTRYELVPGTREGGFAGSYFVEDCLPCGRPTIPVPVGGSFQLGLIDGGPNPTSTYTVGSLEITSLDKSFPYQISGFGIYRQGGEVALLQEMYLRVQVNDDKEVTLAGGPTSFPEGVSFPDIVIDLQQKNPPSEFKVYSLHLEAKLGDAKPAEFLRGDANGDGTADISDAVYDLLWLFSGGATPGCLDAADFDGDGGHLITDPIFLLGFLFQGGPVPPAPGPVSCGVAPEPVFGCESYESCGAS